MGFIEKFKKFKEKQKEKFILRTAGKGFKRERMEKLKQIKLEEKAERFEAKKKQIEKIRQIQLKKERFEAKILQERAKKEKARREIVGVRKQQVRQQFQQTGFKQQKPVGAALMDFGARPMPIFRGTKKKPPRKNIGLGTGFRVV